ncbi:MULTISPECIES: sulfate ABC transporter substrate-binding protein [Rhodococcus]|uniref:Sulfate ABC transporter substrate-binding protein n=1 Tax=Rhodococcus oxybenzonivorans TaxID=1990687 RepID=A0AAE4UV43_9NOCA|nr:MULTISPECIES: sulfate ABC transporter substrate-binding protein [Rhodococcus]MDV7244351.1 sulfate ABC transporter substrate-binding protein [Rhodococcus oxybenzonivorans]MDV7263490.1 sulfate ABC transporter substrate-binding protein [Rhodococcus oxybenzonivorans]MDV7274406.1 sulfate ABC transporter substrate-binding protein [Rhodococcus oxybenzonivorans]MDV7335719.1 sulfate ABC transporter substrate-binding protein [Rhodococcus oxybenzonivorans]MDV7345356.1 sulfate ABC transporter substrate
MKRRSRSLLTALVTLGAVALTACSGGASDTAGSDAVGADGSAGTINLFAYAVPKPGYDKLIPAFNATEEGKNVAFQPSYGASGDQSRKVKDGAEADFVNFSVEPDVTRLVDAGLVDKTWNQDAYNGIPFGSVVTIVVREGNPKNIRDWDDLLSPDVEVVTPNPFSSGSAKWNLLAPYAAKSNGGQDPNAGLAYITSLVNDHVKIQPKSGREASEAFLQGTGDVLLSYENEALFMESNGDPVEHVTPPTTFKIENPVAVLSNSKHLDKANAFKDFLYTPEGQKLWAEAGFRPVDPAVATEFADKFPQPAKLWTIADLGGWSKVDPELFAKDTGSIAVIYDNATR